MSDIRSNLHQYIIKLGNIFRTTNDFPSKVEESNTSVGVYIIKIVSV